MRHLGINLGLLIELLLKSSFLPGKEVQAVTAYLWKAGSLDGFAPRLKA
jgi:hypothetical protein